MKATKIGVLFIVAVLSLTAVGTSYAMWKEDLYMDLSVSPGKLDFDWIVEETYDTEIPEKDDSSSVTAEVDATGNIMTVTITDAYPCIYYYVNFSLLGVGNVPVHFNDFDVSDVPAGWIDNSILYIGKDENNHPGQVDLMDDPDTPEFDGLQLHQNDKWYGQLIFHFTNDDGIGQDETFEFEISLFGYQYNEPCEDELEEKLLDIPQGPHIDALDVEQWEPGYAGYGSGSNPPITPNTYFDVILTGLSPETDDLFDGEWPAFCADEEVNINVNNDYTIELWDSRDDLNMPSYATDDEQWDYVNYILNNWKDVAPTANWQTLQAAIWEFTDSTHNGKYNTYKNVDLAAFNAIVDDATANGFGFNPEAGQWLAVVCSISENTQLVFLVVDP